jgi:hypothetical protein
MTNGATTADLRMDMGGAALAIITAADAAP